MDLKEFVAESLRQIMDGVTEAKTHGSKIGAIVNPHGSIGKFVNLPQGALYRVDKAKGCQYAHDISFDVAVTTIEESHTKGGAKLAVAVFSASGGKQSDLTNSCVSRVQFTVPVFLP